MTEELNSRIRKYRSIISVFNTMLKYGVISDKDYTEIVTIVAKKCEISSSTIFTDITG